MTVRTYEYLRDLLPKITQEKSALAFLRATKSVVTIEDAKQRLFEMYSFERNLRNFSLDLMESKSAFSANQRKSLEDQVGYLWTEGKKECEHQRNPVDERNTEELKAIIADHGWITPSKFGQVAATHAWAIVQHADHDRSFQREILNILEENREIGHCDLQDYAFLYDRVAVADGRLQRYGTQIKDDNKTPQPIEDPENVNARRASVGLGTLEEYLARFGKSNEEPQCAP